LKFLDPQQKLIFDLKDEIKRLRHENIKLRHTISTAPSTADGNNIILELNENIIDIENKQIESVHNLINTTKNKNLSNLNKMSGGRIYGKLYGNQKVELKESKISRVGLYGHEVMQLLASSSDGSINGSSRSSLNYNDESNNNHSASSTTSIDNMSDNGSNSDNNDYHSISSTSSRLRRKIINHDPNSEEIHDLVRRGPTGPIIFRNRKSGQSSITKITPIKETSYFVIPPAQSRLKSMEGKIKEELYKMLVRLEQKSAIVPSVITNTTSNNTTANIDFVFNNNNNNENNNSNEGIDDNRKSSGNGNSNNMMMIGAQSMPLLSNHDNIMNIEKKKNKKNKKKDKEIKPRTFYLKEPTDPPVWKAQKKVSPYVVHLLKKPAAVTMNSNITNLNGTSGNSSDNKIKKISKYQGVVTLPPIVMNTDQHKLYDNDDLDVAIVDIDNEDKNSTIKYHHSNSNNNITSSTTSSGGDVVNVMDSLPQVINTVLSMNNDKLKHKTVQHNPIVLPLISSSSAKTTNDILSSNDVKTKTKKSIHPSTSTNTNANTSSVTTSNNNISKEKSVKLPILPKIPQLKSNHNNTNGGNFSNNNNNNNNNNSNNNSNNNNNKKISIVKNNRHQSISNDKQSKQHGIAYDDTNISSGSSSNYSDHLIHNLKFNHSTNDSNVHRYDHTHDDAIDDHYSQVDPDLVEHLVISDIVNDNKDNFIEKLLKVELSLAQEREVCNDDDCDDDDDDDDCDDDDCDDDDCDDDDDDDDDDCDDDDCDDDDYDDDCDDDDGYFDIYDEDEDDDGCYFYRSRDRYLYLYNIMVTIEIC